MVLSHSLRVIEYLVSPAIPHSSTAHCASLVPPSSPSLARPSARACCAHSMHTSSRNQIPNTNASFFFMFVQRDNHATWPRLKRELDRPASPTQPNTHKIISTPGPQPRASRQVEGILALPNRGADTLGHDLLARVLGQLEVVDARHDRRQVVVRGQRRHRLAPHNGQRRVQRPQPCIK